MSDRHKRLETEFLRRLMQRDSKIWAHRTAVLQRGEEHRGTILTVEELRVPAQRLSAEWTKPQIESKRLKTNNKTKKEVPLRRIGRKATSSVKKRARAR